MATTKSLSMSLLVDDDMSDDSSFSQEFDACSKAFGMLKHGFSLSPEMYAAQQRFYRRFDTPRAKVVLSLSTLIFFPLFIYEHILPATGLINNIIAVFTAWDGLLSISCICVGVHCLIAAYFYVRRAESIPETKIGNLPSFRDTVLACCKSNPMGDPVPLTFKGWLDGVKTYATSSKQRLFYCTAIVVLAYFLALLGLVGPNSLVYPSWLWHPMLWGRYHVYSIKDVAPAVMNICSDHSNLCLSENEWKVLSAGALSSRHYNDIMGVRQGQTFAKQNSIVVNVLARDVKHNIPALRVNVESLVPLFREVALVVFENDSSDGTREIFKDWAAESELEYIVDLMECEGVEDCKLGSKNRDYQENPQHDYAFTSAIGNMHTYRNTAINYIQNDPKYQHYSHLLVLDVDLSVPFSPLGILHTLGRRPNTAVASSGRQPWPTSFGSLTTPYDLSAFREYNTNSTMGLANWHRRFCAIMEPGERWRNECNALSPAHLVAILWNDRKLINGDFYRVDSAFNGAVLYPIDLLRQTGAQYDHGEDGQRCEHVGLHYKLGETKPMLVNKKWEMHLMPNYPGGVAWGRAKKITDRIMLKPKLMLTILFSHLITIGVFIMACFTFCVHGIMPVWDGMFWMPSRGKKDAVLSRMPSRINSTPILRNASRSTSSGGLEEPLLLKGKQSV